MGGKGGPHKELVLVAAEKRARAPRPRGEQRRGTCKRFVDGESHRRRRHDRRTRRLQRQEPGRAAPRAKVQTKAERREADAVQACHWTISLLKRWLIGTHAGAAKPKHLQAYLDEFAFRHNRRKTDGVASIAARVIESVVAKPPLTMRALVEATKLHRRFASIQAIDA